MGLILEPGQSGAQNLELVTASLLHFCLSVCSLLSWAMGPSHELILC